MDEKRATPDALVARIAARQHGVVTNRQRHAAGLTKEATYKRVRAGRLHRVHRGVYAVGHAGLSQEGRWMAAVLAYGDRAVLSHRSAAALWSLLPPVRGSIDIAVAGTAGRRRRQGIRLRRSSSLQFVEVTRRFGIPVTKPARTIADLRRVASGAEVRKAIRQAEVLGLVLNAAVGHPGGATDGTRSELDARFLALCRRHRLPMPVVNSRVGAFTVDFLWREQRLIVETDGYRFHRGRQAFEDDRGRDLELRRLGYEVMRLTHAQVTNEPGRVASTLRARL